MGVEGKVKGRGGKARGTVGEGGERAWNRRKERASHRATALGLAKK